MTTPRERSRVDDSAAGVHHQIPGRIQPAQGRQFLFPEIRFAGGGEYLGNGTAGSLGDDIVEKDGRTVGGCLEPAGKGRFSAGHEAYE